MKIGMLWFDNDPKVPLAEKIKRAADYYQDKYGCTPEVCYVNPVHLRKAELGVVPVLVLENNSVLPNHFWIGA